MPQHCGSEASLETLASIGEKAFFAPQAAREDTAPGAAAARVNRILKKRKLEQVFVAGELLEGSGLDCKGLRSARGVRRELRAQVKEVRSLSFESFRGSASPFGACSSFERKLPGALLLLSRGWR